MGGGGGGKWLQLLDEQIVIEFQKKKKKKLKPLWISILDLSFGYPRTELHEKQ